MKDFFLVFKRFVPPYKYNLASSIFYNILHAIFSGIAMLFAIPVLEVLFETTKEVHHLLPWELSKSIIQNNLYYYVTLIKLKYGVTVVMPFIGGLLLIATMFKVGFAYLASTQMIIIRNGVVRDIRKKIYNKLINLPLSFYSEERKGDVISRATGDVNEVESSIMSSIDMFFKNPILIITSVAFMLILSYQLTIFVFIMLPIAGWIIGKTGKALKHKSREGQQKMGVMLGIIEESLGGLRIIKAFNAETKMKDRFGFEAESYRRIMNKLQRRYALAHPMSEFLGTIVIVVLVWFGAYIIGNEESSLSGASFIAYIGIFYQIINPAKQFSTAYFNIQKGLAAMERIDKILLADNKITEKKNAESISNYTDKIEYRNITFSYNNEVDVLKNVSLTIPQGKTIALVGQSGSGKTTFVDLLPRFYDVQSGGIFIDGHNIKDIKLFDLRELMGNVNQEAILFNDTIYNNITFGVEHATEEEVIQAAKVANAHDFITATEDGYHTKIGDRGSKLSGGQRQRLSIARAILKNPPILILDEATSALDTESERLVQDALENLMKNRTSLVIAHRLSTVRNADMICVFNEGKIVETGTHDELIALNGIYNKLHSMQMS
ncbi:ABC transporter ATP-binding protein [Carboxylicivirga linearis]|uniref:ABC transporter ATP-binding protein n=1 Tax=Carboxylicivirga linearis TaxID=1628157 RepID=A0ABS5JUI8_9BACT|nr:ABC transporter ATP-binding protein [Carboxylicivirga linearis]MBS2098465.1 ABC transporter ATP-binding protein [Carboxylicivirga linearis]